MVIYRRTKTIVRFGFNNLIIHETVIKIMVFFFFLSLLFFAHHSCKYIVMFLVQARFLVGGTRSYYDAQKITVNPNFFVFCHPWSI